MRQKIRSHEPFLNVVTGEPARACGMEAASQTEHRTKVNFRKGRSVWVSVRWNAMPDIQSWQDGSGSGGTVKLCNLTPGELTGSAFRDGRMVSNGRPTPGEKSDHLVVALKPGNAGGAKGVTG